MANIEDILAKRKEKIEQIKGAQPELRTTPVRKTMERGRGDRPWQPEAGESPIIKEIAKSENLDIPNTAIKSVVSNFIPNQTVEPLDVTEHKVDTNRVQTGHVTEHKVDTNRVQTGHIEKTNIAAKLETGHKVDTQPDTAKDTKRAQTGHKVDTNNGFSALVGLQKELTLLIYKSCQKNRSKVSDPMTLEFVSNSLKIKIGSVKTTFRRLENKQILTRVEYKSGRGGWAKFELSKIIFSEILQNETEHKLDTNRTQSVHKLNTQPDTEPDTRSPIVVVSSNYKNTTNTEPLVPDEHSFTIPNELSGKVSRRQLAEFVLAGKISVDELQLSLDAFAYDLKHKLVSLKHSSNPIALLIGAIKNNGSYNSAKYVEALKSELKPLLTDQCLTTEKKTDHKASKEWADFQIFKLENPDQLKKLEEKLAKYGFTGAMLEDFTFLEYKKEVLKEVEDFELNPLRPHESATP